MNTKSARRKVGASLATSSQKRQRARTTRTSFRKLAPKQATPTSSTSSTIFAQQAIIDLTAEDSDLDIYTPVDRRRLLARSTETLSDDGQISKEHPGSGPHSHYTPQGIQAARCDICDKRGGKNEKLLQRCVNCQKHFCRVCLHTVVGKDGQHVEPEGGFNWNWVSTRKLPTRKLGKPNKFHPKYGKATLPIKRVHEDSDDAEYYDDDDSTSEEEEVAQKLSARPPTRVAESAMLTPLHKSPYSQPQGVQKQVASRVPQYYQNCINNREDEGLVMGNNQPLSSHNDVQHLLPSRLTGYELYGVSKSLQTSTTGNTPTQATRQFFTPIQYHQPQQPQQQTGIKAPAPKPAEEFNLDEIFTIRDAIAVVAACNERHNNLSQDNALKDKWCQLSLDQTMAFDDPALHRIRARGGRDEANKVLDEATTLMKIKRGFFSNSDL